MALGHFDGEGFESSGAVLMDPIIGATVDPNVTVEDTPGTAPFPGCMKSALLVPGVGKSANKDSIIGDVFTTTDGLWYGIDVWVYWGNSPVSLQSVAAWIDWTEGKLAIVVGGGGGTTWKTIIRDANGVEVGAYDVSPIDDLMTIGDHVRVQILWRSSNTVGQCKARFRKDGDTSWTTLAESDANQDFRAPTPTVDLHGQTGSTSSPPFHQVHIFQDGWHGISDCASDYSDFPPNFKWIRHSIHRDQTTAADCDQAGTAAGDAASGGNWKNVGIGDAGTGKFDESLDVQMASKSGGLLMDTAGADEGSYGDAANDQGPSGHPLIDAGDVPLSGRWSVRAEWTLFGDVDDRIYFGHGPDSKSLPYTIVQVENPSGGGHKYERHFDTDVPDQNELALIGISGGSTIAKLEVGVYQSLWSFEDAVPAGPRGTTAGMLKTDGGVSE